MQHLLSTLLMGVALVMKHVEGGRADWPQCYSKNFNFILLVLSLKYWSIKPF